MGQEAHLSPGLSARSREYSSIKYCLALVDLVYLVVLLFLFLGPGGSRWLAGYITRSFPAFFITPVYILIIYAAYYLLNLPFNYYQSFILEHQFCLSNQRPLDWAKDQLKSAVIMYLILVLLFKGFYYILAVSPFHWWLVVSLFWVLFSFVLAKLAPVLIIPLFFKYKELNAPDLKARLINLSEKMQVKILDVFEIDFSKKTLKANAALVGQGQTRRVLLADTLKDKYSADEIEVILAHEFAHHKLKHLAKLILMNSLATLASFYLIFRTSRLALDFFGLTALSDIAALPLVLLYFTAIGLILQPLQNYISRRMELNADREALRVTNNKEAFISMMNKISAQNLSDRAPHPLIKFIFFDHPPTEERIQAAQHSFTSRNHF